jgi:hypothetical protein
MNYFVKQLAIIAVIAVVTVAGFAIWFGIAWSRGEERARQSREDLRTGKEHFGDQPALFAVAQAIVRNDQEAIRAAAKNVPDLQTPGREGRTLLHFAVSKTYHHDEHVEAVKTLLSLGANPNHNNGQPDSFAMVEAAEGSALVLRAMLDGGGDPNGRDEDGIPMILRNWRVSFYTDSQSRARLDLLLDRGADINSTMPESRSCCIGYSVLLYRTSMGLDKPQAYADALHLLERGADPHRVAPDGMTFAKMLVAHREQFARESKGASPELVALWKAAESRGILTAQ